jgi:hypothetical protein
MTIPFSVLSVFSVVQSAVAGLDAEEASAPPASRRLRWALFR